MVLIFLAKIVYEGNSRKKKKKVWSKASFYVTFQKFGPSLPTWWPFFSFAEAWLMNKILRYLQCTVWWFDICTPCERILPIEFINTCTWPYLLILLKQTLFSNEVASSLPGKGMNSVLFCHVVSLTQNRLSQCSCSACAPAQLHTLLHTHALTMKLSSPALQTIWILPVLKLLLRLVSLPLCRQSHHNMSWYLCFIIYVLLTK